MNLLDKAALDRAFFPLLQKHLEEHLPDFLDGIVERRTRWCPEDPPPSWDDLEGLQVTIYDNWLYNDGKRPRKARRAGQKSMPNSRKARYQIELETFALGKAGKWWFIMGDANDARKLCQQKGKEWIKAWADHFEENADKNVLFGFGRSKVQGNGTKYHQDCIAIWNLETDTLVISTSDGDRTFKNPTQTTMDDQLLFDAAIIGGKVKSSAVKAWRVGTNPFVSSTRWASHPWLK